MEDTLFDHEKLPDKQAEHNYKKTVTGRGKA